MSIAMTPIRARALRAGRTRTFLDTVAEMGATHVGAKIIDADGKYRQSWPIDTEDARGRLTQTLGRLYEDGSEVEWWAFSTAADGNQVYYEQQWDWDVQPPVQGRFWAFQIAEGGNIVEVGTTTALVRVEWATSDQAPNDMPFSDTGRGTDEVGMILDALLRDETVTHIEVFRA